MAKIPLLVEKWFTVGSLLLSTGVLTTFTGITTAGEVQSSSLLQLLWTGVYLVTIFLLIMLRKSVVKVITRDKLLWLLVGFVVLSTLWSTAPGFTLRRVTALVGTTFFGVYLATRYSFEQQMRLLAWTLGIGAILSVLYTIVAPAYAIDFMGSWRGIFITKNGFARLMVLGAMVFLLLATNGRRYRWFPWFMFSLSCALILLSTSKSALVNIITLLALLVLYRSLRWQYTWSIPLWIFCILTIGGTANLLLSSSDLVLRSLGKDATLTGRTEVWEAVLQMIWKRPVLGYGYDGFWTSFSNSPAINVWNSITWHPLHAHNGFLNLCLEIGLLGAMVFLLGYIYMIVRSVSWIRLTKTSEGFWPLLYMTYTFMYNLSESSLLNQNNILWIVYVAIGLSIPVSYTTRGKT